jgi:hypothetical protein
MFILMGPIMIPNPQVLLMVVGPIIIPHPKVLLMVVGPIVIPRPKTKLMVTGPIIITHRKTLLMKFPMHVLLCELFIQKEIKIDYNKKTVDGIRVFFFLIYVLIRYPELNVIFFLWNEFDIFVIILAVGICNQFVSARD